MLRIMRQDLIFNRNNLLLMLAIMSCVLIYFSARADGFSPRAYFVLAAFYVGASMGITLAAREDKHKTAALICSLPVRRSTVIAARFVLTWALMLLTLVYASVLTAVLPFSQVDLSSAVNVKFVLVGLLILSAVFSLMLPFTVRFGVMGVMLFLVAGQVLALLAMLAVHFFRMGNSSWSFPLRTVSQGLRFLLGPNSTFLHMLAVVAVILFLNGASFFASRALYARRDL
ncbi:MAG: ABC-2 transporter permease [Candidatus Aminicenantes bacterium]|nr:ABC-2 transporter permease [Candidatus Aminicenantes bacterium]